MSIGTMIYTIVIGPLKLIFELVYSMAYIVSGSAGISIIILSMIMNLLLLPLYNRADRIQEEENELQKKLKPGIEHIKKSFSGDEQYFILNTYYRQNNYKPIYSLRNSVSLLLEIPFFIAAYDFLSNLQLLQDSSFGIIRDLGVPDGLAFGVNVLPVLMTVINILSSMVYTRGQSFKDNIQLYIMALLFLALLYQRPSGLVLYWTLNNVFSLVKNIIVKFVHFRKKEEKKGRDLFELFDRKTFFVSCLIICVTIGVLIPSAVIKASPSEFIDTVTIRHPVWYIFTCLLLSVGTFLVWTNIYYGFMDEGKRNVMSFVFVCISLIFLADFLFFGKDLGTMSNKLVYDVLFSYSLKQIAINAVVLAATVVLVYLLKKFMKSISVVVLISVLLISCFNTYSIIGPGKDAISRIRENNSHVDEFSITLSKNGKNVVVIMLDRAINSYFPFLLEEKPELQRQFEGFTYYPNSLSYSFHTIFAAPALFGGYEYTPVEINKRSDESLRDKHNEALKVLPVLFDENGYDVTVCDAPLANYEWISDMSIYDEYEDIRTYNLSSAFSLDGFDDIVGLESLERNMFVYAIMKASPLAIQTKIYNSGLYHNMNYKEYTSYLSAEFLNSYALLCNFVDRTEVKDLQKGSLFVIADDTTHSPSVLQEPDYAPSKTIDNKEYDQEHRERKSIDGRTLTLETDEQYRHYMVNMAAMIKLGEWFDCMRENGVYDNTRIIIVSDHGRAMGQFEDLLIKGEIEDDIMRYNPLFLVKDFNSQVFSVDDSFVTDADVPSIATEGLIDDPVNPFTGKKIENSAKNGVQYVTPSSAFDFEDNQGNQFYSDVWYGVEGDPLNPESWFLADMDQIKD